MSIPEALRLAADTAGWSNAKIADACEVSEVTVKRWAVGAAVPPGDKLLVLQRVLPGFVERLGFSLPATATTHAAEDSKSDAARVISEPAA
jgi:ribosome-binding protein aMBF1 (putative translation factor)